MSSENIKHNNKSAYGFDWYSYGGFRECKVSGTVSTGFDRLRGGTTIVVIKNKSTDGDKNETKQNT